MYNFKLKITEVKKGQDEKEVISMEGRARTLKSACQEIRRGTLGYVSKNRKVEE